LRNSLKINQFFIGILPIEDQDFIILDSIVDSFGEINDFLVAFHGEKKKEKKQQLIKRINFSWKELKKKVKDQKVKAILRKY